MTLIVVLSASIRSTSILTTLSSLTSFLHILPQFHLLHTYRQLCRTQKVELNHYAKPYSPFPCVLLFILIATRLDIMLGSEFIRDTLIIGYIVNELISITENAGLMGVPMPETLQ